MSCILITILILFSIGIPFFMYGQIASIHKYSPNLYNAQGPVTAYSTNPVSCLRGKSSFPCYEPVAIVTFTHHNKNYTCELGGNYNINKQQALDDVKKQFPIFSIHKFLVNKFTNNCNYGIDYTALAIFGLIFISFAFLLLIIYTYNIIGKILINNFQYTKYNDDDDDIIL